MALDLTDAAEQREFGALIPDGTFVKLVMAIREGGHSMPPTGDEAQDMLDYGIFKASGSSDAIMIDAEMTVDGGRYNNQKIWQFYTVAGGSLDANGMSKAWPIAKSAFRAMIDCATGLDPKDESDQAKRMRVMRGFKDLDGIWFYARVGVEAGGEKNGGGNYADKNIIAHIVVPNEPEWAMMNAGQEPPPQPRGVRGGTASRGGAAAAQDMSKPAWQREAAPSNQAPPVRAAAPAGPAWANNGGAAAAPQAIPPTAPIPAIPPTAPIPAIPPTAPIPASPSNAPSPAAPAASGPSWLRK